MAAENKTEETILVNVQLSRKGPQHARGAVSIMVLESLLTE
jgi:hypothetical protein